jgi:HSP20 family molecular chaperone IbpA
MSMKKAAQFKIAPELLRGIDLSNSINGGSSEIENLLKKTEDGYELRVKAPGVAIEDVSIEVVEGIVVVYYLFPVYKQEEGEGERFARVIGNFSLPADADYEQVSASYRAESAVLKIQIPFNGHQREYRSKITIQR